MTLQWRHNEQEKGDDPSYHLPHSPPPSCCEIFLSLANMWLSWKCIILSMRSTSSSWAEWVLHTEQVPWCRWTCARCWLPIFWVWLLLFSHSRYHEASMYSAPCCQEKNIITSYTWSNPCDGQISTAFHCCLFTFSHQIHLALFTNYLNYSVHTRHWP